VDESPKKGEKLSRVWTHTLGLVGLVAAVVTIVSFFGFRPPTAVQAPKVPAGPDAPSTQMGESKSPPVDAAGPPVARIAPRPNGTGTLHLDGGFPAGQAMTTIAALVPGDQQTISLKNSRTTKVETVSELQVPLGIDSSHLVSVWRKGASFVHGLRLTGTSPHLHLSVSGGMGVDVPTDSNGKLLMNLVWPADQMFTQVEFVGPVEISGHILDGGVMFGDPHDVDNSRALPLKFSLDIPRPGEILGAIKGEFRYITSADKRVIFIRALSSADTPIAIWSAPIDTSQATNIQDYREDVLDRTLYGIQVLTSKARS
jgi:hypothetical protein